MKKIYVAGPMTGMEHLNFDAFDIARDFLQDHGWVAVSPADLTRISRGWGKYPPADAIEELQTHAMTIEVRWEVILMDLVALSACEAIYMLVGWENSKGARVEKALADFLGLTVIYELGAEHE